MAQYLLPRLSLFEGFMKAQDANRQEEQGNAGEGGDLRPEDLEPDATQVNCSKQDHHVQQGVGEGDFLE